MTPDQYAKAKALFRAVIDADPEVAEAAMCSAADDDPDIAAWVQRLLRADVPESFLEPLVNWPDDLGAPRETSNGGPIAPRIGMYRITRRIGEGAAAEVFEGEHGDPPERVAVKVLRYRQGRREVLARFATERKTLALLDHPGIVRILDAGLAPDGRPYFAMELVEGRSIAEHCRECRPSEQGGVALFARLCEAVEHAHRHGVIHRDLKPSNILIAMASGSPMPKVIDFGLAKIVDRRLRPDSFSSADGQIAGTLSYLAPEALTGEAGGADVRGDVYSLGAVLYEVLARRPAFDGPEMALAAVVRRITDRGPPPLKEVASDLRAIVSRAMARDPRDRYQSVSDMKADVLRFLEHRPVSARRTNPVYIARRFAARHPVAVAVAALLISGTLVLAVQWWEAQQRVAALTYDLLDRVERMLELQAAASNQLGQRDRRRAIVELAIPLCEGLARSDPDDPRVRSARAELLLAMADLAEQDREVDTAERCIAEALSIRRALHAERAGDRELAWKVAHALIRRGDLLRLRLELDPRWQEAGPQPIALARLVRASYSEAQAVVEGLASSDPSDALMAARVAFGHERLGFESERASALAAARLREDEAADELARAERLYRLQDAAGSSSVLAGDPDGVRCRVSAHIHLSRLDENAGNLDSAVAHARVALALAKSVTGAELRPAGDGAGHAHLTLARLLQRANRPAEAVVEFRFAFALADAALAHDKADRDWMQVMNASALAVLEAHASAGETRDAEAVMASWIRHGEAFRAETGDRLGTQSLMEAHQQCAVAAARLGLADRAAGHDRRATQLLREAAQDQRTPAPALAALAERLVASGSGDDHALAGAAADRAWPGCQDDKVALKRLQGVYQALGDQEGANRTRVRLREIETPERPGAR